MTDPKRAGIEYQDFCLAHAEGRIGDAAAHARAILAIYREHGVFPRELKRDHPYSGDSVLVEWLSTYEETPCAVSDADR